MKLSTRTIITLIVFNPMIAGPAAAQFGTGPVTFTISGNTGVGDVVMKGLPGSPVSDGSGYYSAKVPYRWTGTVVPAKEGYTFEPVSLGYTRVVADSAGGDYTARQTPSNAPSSGSHDSVARTPPRSRSRSSDSFSDSMYEDSSSRSRRRSSSGYKPAIRSGRRKVLVIPASEVNEFNAEEIAETIEDMHIMSHILDDGFKEPRRIQGFFTDFGDFFGRDSRATEATYLEGFGVLFLMEVNFAFSTPPRERKQDPTEAGDATDSTWQKARRQVLSPGVSPGMGQEDSTDDYGNRMVEELKKELIETLKHASNIRNVKPEEWIILTVIGGQRQFGMGTMMGGSMGGYMGGGMSGVKIGGMSSGMGSMSSTMGGMSSGRGGGMGGGMYGGMGGMYGGMGGMYGEMGSRSETSFSSSTVLTIRAKKANVDDFAAGQLDLEQFQENVQIFTY